MRFEGKVAVVTGAASGIGRATALRLASEGAIVWLGDINDAEGERMVAAGDGRMRYLHCDVTEPDQIAGLIAATQADGGLDLLFNNAGAGGGRSGVQDMSVEEWDRVQALLLRSVMLGTHHAAPVMAAKGGGAIVNTASIAGVQSGAAALAYSVAKAGVIHLTRLTAAELSRHNIRVNAVCPGFIVTNIFTAALGLPDEQREGAQRMIAGAAEKAQPVRRAGRPEDVAGLVTYLLSDDAGFVTGEKILVDGGLAIGPRHSWDPDSPGLFGRLQQPAGAAATAG